MTSNKQPTAAMIVIGNEVLSGRTKDKNIGWVAEQLEQNGIKLVEARIIRDDQETIISTIKEIYKLVDYVFTSGGIGNARRYFKKYQVWQKNFFCFNCM